MPLRDPQRLLLRAALGKRGSAAAWQEWRRANQVDALEGQTAALAPLLYRNLEEGDIERADLSRLRGAYRFGWSKYQQARKSLASALDRLAEAGISCALHGECALAFAGPYRPGTRALQRLDLLIKAEDLTTADAALRSAGWSALRSLPSDRLMPFLAGIPYRHPNASPLFLVWHPAVLAAGDTANEAFWQRLRMREIEGLQVPCPDPSDLLLVACAQSASWGARGPGPLSIADLYLLATAVGDPVDWQALRQRSAEFSLTAEVSGGLRCLRDEAQASLLDITIPVALLACATPSEFPKNALLPGLAGHWRLYQRVRRLQGDDTSSLAGFLTYLLMAHRWYWQVSSLWQMPLALVRHCLARLPSAKSTRLEH